MSIGWLGTAISVALWLLLHYLQSWLPFPEFHIAPGWRWFFCLLFGIDALVAVLWARQSFGHKPTDGGQLIVTGPYALMRHPMYAAVLWNGTAITAFGLGSWFVLLAVVPLHLVWVWLVRIEEEQLAVRYGAAYEAYTADTGQFFPRWETLKKITRTGRSENGE